MTLRARLGWALGGVVVVVVLSAVGILQLVRASLTDGIDRQLESATTLVSSRRFIPSAPPPSDFVPPNGPGNPFGTTTGSNPRLTELFVGDVSAGKQLKASIRPDLGSNASPDVTFTMAKAHASSGAHPRPFTASSSDGSHDFRVVSTRDGQGGYTVIALPTDRVQVTYRRVQLGMAGAGAFLLATLTLAVWWVQRLGLRPIRAVTATADAIAAGDIGRRVDTPSRRTEAGRLAEAFNVMVDQRQATEDQLRQFVADASHELRTPLATVAGVLELHHNGTLPNGADLDDALQRANQEAKRMSGLVTDLLELVDLDRGISLRCRSVDLSELLTDAAFDVSVTSPQRTIETTCDPYVTVWGDEARLRQVIANLVSNAVAYTPPTGHITLSAHAVGDTCELVVSDDGPGIPPGQAARVFDRFYRTDIGRARSSGGSGLGLSIVQSIVHAHGGTVSAQPVLPHGTTFRVVLPRHSVETSRSPTGASTTAGALSHQTFDGSPQGSSMP